METFAKSKKDELDSITGFHRYPYSKLRTLQKVCFCVFSALSLSRVCLHTSSFCLENSSKSKLFAKVLYGMQKNFFLIAKPEGDFQNNQSNIEL